MVDWQSDGVAPTAVAPDQRAGARRETVAAVVPLHWFADLLLPFALGALTTLAFAPFKLFPLNLLTLAAMYELWYRATPRQAALRGWLFGLGNFATGIYWIYISVHEFGGTPAWAGVLMTALLVVYLALYPALVGYVSARWMSTGPIVRGLVVFPALWTLSELLRGTLLTGFPWLSTGYAWVGSLFRGVAPLIGVFGIGWIVALLAGTLWLLFRAPWVLRPVMLLLGSAMLVGFWFMPSPLAWTRNARDKPITATLIQGSVAQSRKWAPGNLAPTERRYLTLTRDSVHSRLLIWPEAAIPALYRQVDNNYFADVRQLLDSRGQTLLTGMLVQDSNNQRIYNSVIAMGQDSGHYLKRHLVPFGEYFPIPGFLKTLFRYVVDIPFDSISPGPWQQRLIKVDGVPVGLSICYEDAFSGDIRTELPGAQLLINVSNDAWFGHSIALAQHLQIARMRALETGRPMLRDTNTGITALIGADGTVFDRAPPFEPQRLRVTVIPRTGETPFVRHGELPMWLLTIAASLIGLWLGGVFKQGYEFFTKRSGGRR